MATVPNASKMLIKDIVSIGKKVELRLLFYISEMSLILRMYWVAE